MSDTVQGIGGTGKNKTIMFTDFIIEYWKGDNLSKHTRMSNVDKCYEEKEKKSDRESQGSSFRTKD